MKFYNGHWEKKMGVSIHNPKEVYEYNNRGNQIQMIVPDRNIYQKGMTLDGLNFTILISVPHPEVFRVQVFHYMGTRRRGPEFVLEISEEILCLEDEEEDLMLTSGRAQLVIHKNEFQMVFYYDGEIKTMIRSEDIAYIRTEDKGFLYEEFSGQQYMRCATSIGVGECLYGLGEHFGPLVKNGQSIDLWNEDGGTSSDVAYKNIPFYLSNRSYGVFVNHSELVSMEIGTEKVERAAFSVKGEQLDFFVLLGEEMKDVLVKYTDLTGKPAKVPEWSLGLWLSTSFLTEYDEKTVLAVVDEMAAREIPLRVFHFDCCWMKEFHWCDFLWDRETFPDPEGMLKKLHDKGLKICVWINPYIAQASHLFPVAMEKGYLLCRSDGDVWQCDKWQAGMAIVDFTNPEAKHWYQTELAKLLDMGVDCFKTDFGERIPVTDICYYDGSSPEKMHNYYSYLYNETVYQIVEKKKGHENAIVFARSGTAGGQKFPVHWGGDCFASYEAMAESLRGGLSLTMSGYGYWSHDIGGFEDTSTPDVYKRWVAFGLLSTHSRLHGSNSYRVPWLYGEEAVQVVKHFVKVKQSLQSYLLEQTQRCHETGIPVMRAMVLEFPQDPNCVYLDRQYMLGDRYLVAPVFCPDSRAEYYLPAGKWQNYFTGEIISLESGKWFTERVDYFTIPLFERKEA